MARIWLHTRLVEQSYRLQLYGELDGSTACQVLEAVANAPATAREVVVDLDGVTRVEAFGFEVLARSARSSARGRPVRVTGRFGDSDAAGATGGKSGDV